MSLPGITGNEVAVERPAPYLFEQSLIIAGAVSSLLGLVYVFLGISTHAADPPLILGTVVILFVLAASILAILSRQRARIYERGIAPSWRWLCRRKGRHMIPWEGLDRVETKRVGQSWRLLVYPKGMGRYRAPFEVPPFIFDHPDELVATVGRHFPIEVPTEQRSIDMNESWKSRR